MIYIIFVRGINVGGKTKVTMSVLKDQLLKDAFINVRTHLNSGNIIVSTALEKSKVKNKVKEIINHHFKIDPHMMVLDLEEIKSIIENDPFDLPPTLYSKKCVGLTQSERFFNFTHSNWMNEHEEDIHIIGNYIYIYYVNGQAKTKLTTNFIEKKLGLSVTIRNWNTLLKVYQIAREVSHGA